MSRIDTFLELAVKQGSQGEWGKEANKLLRRLDGKESL